MNLGEVGIQSLNYVGFQREREFLLCPLQCPLPQVSVTLFCSSKSTFHPNAAYHCTHTQPSALPLLILEPQNGHCLCRDWACSTAKTHSPTRGEEPQGPKWKGLCLFLGTLSLKTYQKYPASGWDGCVCATPRGEEPAPGLVLGSIDSPKGGLSMLPTHRDLCESKEARTAWWDCFKASHAAASPQAPDEMPPGLPGGVHNGICKVVPASSDFGGNSEADYLPSKIFFYKVSY